MLSNSGLQLYIFFLIKIKIYRLKIFKLINFNILNFREYDQKKKEKDEDIDFNIFPVNEGYGMWHFSRSERIGMGEQLRQTTLRTDYFKMMKT